MNNSFYFQHDYNARNDQKLLELRSEFGAEGYGIWWMILETLAEQEEGIDRGAIGGLSLAFGVGKAKLNKIIGFCLQIGLLYEVEGYVRNERMDEHKNWRKSLAQAGKKGAENRWKNKGGDGGANGPPNGNNRIGKEKTEKKKKRGEPSSLSWLSDLELGEFKPAWEDYLKHRKEMKVKKYASAKSERLAFKDLLKISGNDPERAQEIVDQSRKWSWRGLFPLKEDKKNSKITLKEEVYMSKSPEERAKDHTHPVKMWGRDGNLKICKAPGEPPKKLNYD